MKINIKKFMELANVSFTTPAKIEAGHDVGKSTIFRAVLFAITGKDLDGKEFDGRIYPKKAESLSELAVEVEIEQDGVIFCKKANGAEKRQKGSDEIELQRSVTATYIIDFKVVGKAEYDAKIKGVFDNFQLLSNPDYFRNLKKEDKRAIFTSLVKIDKNDYFNGLADKTTINGKLKAQRAEIAAAEAKISEFSKVQEPQKIEIEDFESQLAEIRKQRQAAVPELTFLQVEANNEINRKIAEIEKSEFLPKATTPYLIEPVRPKIIDTHQIETDLISWKASKPNEKLFDDQIERLREKTKTINGLQMQIDNYDENVKQAKCVLCQVCASPNCSFKRVEMLSLDELKNELSKLMTIDEVNESINNLESQKIKYLREFADKKESNVFRLQKELNDAISSNKEAVDAFFIEKTQIDEANAQIFAENSKIQIENSNNRANFEAEKAKKISELKAKIHTPAPFDYSEFDAKISELTEKKNAQQKAVDAFNNMQGAYNYAQNRSVVLKNELEQMRQALYGHEREMIKIEAAENKYYSDFEALINNEMPENVHVSLFKKNISNDERSDVFEIEFNGSIYAGNGKTIAFYIWLCSWFQFKFGKDLPIFIDEAIILNESLYSDVKNAVVLMRNDNCKILKITEL